MARHLPSLNALRAFEAAGRHGRMIQAAAELNVTHSAISRQIRHLEEVLGVTLFEGPKNRLELTEAGHALLPGLVSGFDQIDKAVRLVADTEDGPIDVSCLGTFTMRWLIPRLYGFQAAHAGISVRLTSSDGPIDLAREGFDVAIRVGTGPWPPDAQITTLFGEQVGPVLAPQLARRYAPNLTGLPLLHTQTRPEAWADWLARSGIGVKDEPGIGYEHFYFMLEAAMAGLGVCIAPWPLVADDIHAGRLVAPYGFIESGMDYVAIRRTRPHRKSALFCEWLKEEARQFKPWRKTAG
ncbi:LysR family transcriptional regulator [Pseudaminobacter arsenicus]|uniref:LysR family transcriptional regulator n=1 Tax=Borborobacter arsenicus TaxID=1851146 RepID=A0A432VAT8_9HYPH|nr:LysR substrate-binding domain-containing protein [Pseudaminobacter arsenicus]RUM99298.1 LysR family transcriptional regulator [Pseudaminobacter arsenicus]